MKKKKFRNRFDYRFSKLAPDKQDRILNWLGKRLARSGANDLDFYDYNLKNKGKEVRNYEIY